MHWVKANQTGLNSACPVHQRGPHRAVSFSPMSTEGRGGSHSMKLIVGSPCAWVLYMSVHQLSNGKGLGKNCTCSKYVQTFFPLSFLPRHCYNYLHRIHIAFGIGNLEVLYSLWEVCRSYTTPLKKIRNMCIQKFDLHRDPGTNPLRILRDAYM